MLAPLDDLLDFCFAMIFNTSSERCCSLRSEGIAEKKGKTGAGGRGALGRES
jgi:hypothetical protein